MSATAQRLRDVVEAGTTRLLAIDDARASEPIAPGKWSRKETLGHLIDSASNNHGRFVRAALNDPLVGPDYAQDEWVAVQQYASAPWQSLITLWREFNLHLARVMDAVPEDARMSDYIAHLEHHLRRILD